MEFGEVPIMRAIIFVAILNSCSGLLAAPSTESCPDDSILLAESCKCNIDSCVKPPCLYELVLSSNGSDTPGQCCPTYSCVGCSNETLIDEECPCAPEALLINNICTCQDPYKTLQNNECVCDPNLCELPQLCDERSVAVTDKEGCCSKTKCIKCPDDSYKSPQNHNGEFEDICLCYPCKTECGPDETVKIMEKGKGFPEQCCDLYTCEPDFSKKKCLTDDVVYAEGETWQTEDFQICECINGLSFCKGNGKESFSSCHKEGAVYQHLDSWEQDSCTNCTCFDGHVNCVAESCGLSSGRINKAGCPPLINCEETCPYGFILNNGCQICECRPEPDYGDILETFNISRSKLYEIVADYFSKSKTTTVIPILVKPTEATLRDSGYLLHRVVWDSEETFNVILDKYVQYIRRHFGSRVTVVFDGYNDCTRNIKAAEQRRRTLATPSSSDILFDEHMTVPTSQQKFLTNIHNKSRFISMLKEKLTAENILVKQANNDADVLIIETAIEQFNLTNTTIVVGEDVDLLVLLTARTPTEKTIFFLKPGKAQHQSETYSSQSLSTSAKCQNHVLFLHAITGCDTTSAFYRRGKITVFKMFEKQNLVQCAEVFKNSNSTRQEIITNGIRFLLSMYGAPKKTTCLDKYRYACFVKNTKSKKQVQLACLPPTSVAAHQHLFRVYYQVQVWLGNQLDPTDWVWKLVNNALEPVQSLLPPAPEKLLNTIFCNCKKGCSAKCGCKKVGLFCSLACTYCQGRLCSNVESTTMEDSFDSDEVTCNTSLLTQFTCNSNEDEEQEQEEEEQEEDQEEEQEEDQEEEFESYESDD